MIDRTLRIDSCLYVVPGRVWAQIRTMAQTLSYMAGQIEARDRRIADLQAELALRNSRAGG